MPPATGGRETRFRVSVAVRFASAHDFVEEYAENLSRGGIFVPGAEHLQVRDTVQIEIDLPGFRTFQVIAEVAHVLSKEAAARVGRRAGAGLAVKEAPADFKDALTAYLVRLGGRRDAVVYSAPGPLADTLAEAGFTVEALVEPVEILERIAASTRLVVGVMVPAEAQPTYLAMLEGTIWEGVVMQVTAQTTFAAVIHDLDQAVVLMPMLS